MLGDWTEEASFLLCSLPPYQRLFKANVASAKFPPSSHFEAIGLTVGAVAQVSSKERVATTPLSSRSTPRGGCSSILPPAVGEQSVQSGVMYKLNFDHFLVTQHQNIALFLLLHCTNHNYCLPCPLILGHPSIYYSSTHPWLLWCGAVEWPLFKCARPLIAQHCGCCVFGAGAAARR